MRCVVSGCDFYGNTSSQNVPFHLLPSEAALRELWLRKLGMEGWEPAENDGVCSSHFLKYNLDGVLEELYRIQTHAMPLVYTQNTSKRKNVMKPCDIKVCRICFASNCKLFLMNEYKNLDQAYEILTGLQINHNDNMPPYLCGECSCRLQNCVQFRTKTIQANIALQEIIQKNCNLTLEAIESCSGYHLFSSNLSIIHKPTDHYDLEMEHVETENTDDTRKPYAVSLIKVENDEMLIQNNTHEQGGIFGYMGPPGLHEVTVPGFKIEEDNVYNQDNIKHEIISDGYQEDLVNLRNTLGNQIKVETIEVNNQDSSDDNNISDINASDYIPDVNVGEDYFSAKLPLEDEPKLKYRTSTTIPKNGCEFKGDRQKTDFDGRQEKYNDVLLRNACPDQAYNESQSQLKVLTATNSEKQTSKKLHSCNICKKSFSHRYNLNTHLRTHTGIRPYLCDVCKKEFNLKGDLSNHLKIHTGEKPYACNICNKTFILRNVLETHMRTHTGERPYTCGLCDKAFTQRANLIAHSKTHSGARPYSCEVCDKAFSQRCNLLTHYRTHSGEKPFSCDICMTSFSRKYQLKTHMLIHSGEKPFTCNICHKSFNSRSNRQEHMSIHTGVKPYSCDICKKAFNRKGNLNIHILTHSDNRPFPCAVCDKAFRRKDQLRNHQRVHLAETALEVNVMFSK